MEWPAHPPLEGGGGVSVNMQAIGMGGVPSSSPSGIIYYIATKVFSC